jgi:DNA-binding transcriptional LysR family regulator
MELRHLRCVAAVARHGSFTKAGEELHLAQSAVSQQVRRLELELGIEVFRRNARRVEVTPEGRLVLEHAHRVLAEVDDLHTELEELTGLVKGRVALGAMYPTGPYDLPGVLAAFHARHPGVDIHMLEDTQDAMLELLRTDQLDCAYASVDPDALGDEFAATLLWEEDLVVAMRPGHPLAEGTCVTLEQLARETLIAYRDNSALRRRLETALGARELLPRNAFVCTEMGAVRALASAGLGVSVLPRSIASQSGPPIAWRPFGPVPLGWPVALVWRPRRRQSAAAKAFLALALDGAVAATEVPRLHRAA